MLTVYVETWATYVAAMARLRTDGLTMTNPDSGHTSAHPCVSVANTAAGQLRAFANEFGLSRSPSASWAASRRRTTRARTRTGAAEAIETTRHTQRAPKMSIGRSRDAGCSDSRDLRRHHQKPCSTGVVRDGPL